MHAQAFHAMPDNDYMMEDCEESMYQQMVPKVVVEEVTNADLMRDIVTEKTFTELEATDIKPKKAVQNLFDENVPVDLRSWTNRYPSNWNPREVMDWVFYMAKEACFDHTTFQAHHFNRKSGEDLCRMTEADFRSCDAAYGPMLYNTLQRLLKQTSTSTVDQTFPHIDTIFTHTTYVRYSPDPHQIPVTVQESKLPMEMHRDAHLPQMDCQDEDASGSLLGLLGSEPNYAVLPNDSPQSGKSVNIYGHEYDFDQQDNFCDLGDEGYISCSPPKEEYSDDSMTRTMSDVSTDELAFQAVMANAPKCYRDYDVADAHYGFSYHPVGAVEMVDSKTTSHKRAPGRPRKNPPAPPKDPNRPKSTRGRKPGQRTKGNHLWEFCRDLLMNPQYNRTHVTWQDRELGVFMINKSAEVAKMWGRQKKNVTMTYEKMSRSMRFCRKATYFMQVPKDGRFPKKLCFRFGPLAEGWEIAARY